MPRKRLTRRRVLTFLAAALMIATAVEGVWMLYQASNTQGNGSSGFAPAQASIGTQTNKTCSSVTTCTSPAIATSSYTTVVLFVQAESASAAAPSGESGSPALTFTLIGDISNGTKGTDVIAYIYSSDNVTASASQTVTVTFSASTTYAFEVIDVKSVYTVSKDAIGAGSTGSSSTAVSTTVTTVTANDLVLLNSASNVNGTIAANGDTLSQKTHVGTLTAGELYAVDSSTGSYTIAATLGSSSTWAAIAIALKYAGVPSAPINPGILGTFVNTKTTAACSYVTTCTTTGIAVTNHSAVWVFVAANSTTAPSAVPTDSASHTYTLMGEVSGSPVGVSVEEYVYATNNLAATASSLTVTETFAAKTGYEIGVIDFEDAATVSLNAAGAGTTAKSSHANTTVSPVVQSTEVYSPENHLILMGVATAAGAVTITANGGDIAYQTGASAAPSGAQLAGQSLGTASVKLNSTLSTAEAWAAIAFAIEVSQSPTVASQTITTCAYVTTCTSIGIATVSNSSVWVFISANSTTAPSAVPTDSGSHTYVLQTKSYLSTTNAREEYVYDTDGVAATASLTVTETFASKTGYTIGVVDVQSAGSTSVDTYGNLTGNSGTASAAATPNNGGDLTILGVSVAVGTVTIAASGSDTLLQKANAGATAGGQLTYTDSQGGLSVTNSATFTSEPWASVLVTIKPVGVTTTAIQLQWNAASGPAVNYTAYQATYSAGSCGSYSTKYSVGTVTTYTAKGLTSGTGYCAEISQWNSTGDSAVSSSVSGIYTSHVPTAPSSLTVAAEAGSTTSLQTTWTNPTGPVINDTLFLWTASTCTGTPTSGTSLGVITGDLITGLSAGTTYSIETEVWNLTGGSAETSCTSATTYSLAGQVTSLGITATTATSFALAWTQPSGTIINDTIYYTTLTTCNGPSAIQVSTGGGASAYTITGVAPNTKYCIWVAAWTAGGVGPKSSDVNDTTLSATPGAVTSLAVSAYSTTTITLTWVNPSPPSGSIVNLTAYQGSACYAGTAWASWTSHTSTAGVVTTYQYTGLSGASTYCLAIGAWTQNGEGPLAFINASTTYPVPSAPTGLMEVSASRTTITMAWTNPGSPPLINNTLYYVSGSSCTSEVGHATGVTTTWTAMSLSAGTTYAFEVTAWSTGGQSADSSCVTATTPGAVPPAPTQLTESSLGATWITISWVNPTGYTLFNNSVYVGTTCGTWTTKISTNGVVQFWNVTGLSPSTSYCLGVTAWDAQSNLSNLIQVLTAAILPPPCHGCGTNPFVNTTTFVSAVATYWLTIVGVVLVGVGVIMLFWLNPKWGVISIVIGGVLIAVQVVLILT